MKKELIILGVRGVPASHGGFETFAEFLCRYLISEGWKVTVYCQENGHGKIHTSEWEGVSRIHIPVNDQGPLGTVIFDFRSIVHSLKHKGAFLTLGYNTAIFNVIHRLFFKRNIINMDGIEWKRQKWGRIAKLWFWLNEKFGCWFGNHLVADHPKIAEHLSRVVSKRKISMIPYGGAEINEANAAVPNEYGLDKGRYAIVIARAEPENSIFEIVKAFSKSKRNAKLLVLGDYNPEANPYHKQILEAASEEVIFAGAIYDADTVGALRYFSRFYVHGHQVGGTNPSLVEALGAGSAVLAHDNPFNRWVAKDGAVYFNSIEEAHSAFTLLFDNETKIEELRSASRKNFRDNFQWNDILKQYESLLLKWL